MKRLTGLDILRTFAILFVVGVHFFLNTSFYKAPLAGNNMLFQVGLRWSFIVCVPLFLILTGYLQTKKEPDMNYFKNILRIVGVYIFYSILAIAMRVFYFHETKSMLRWILDILAFRANAYSWYINMYIGLFLLIPFLNRIIRSFKSAKEFRILLVVLIFITGMPGFIGMNKVLPFPNWWMTLYPITYYFLGAYIKEYPIKIKKMYAAACFIAVTLLEAIITIYFSKGKAYYNLVGDYGSILIVVQSLSFFLIFYDIRLENKFANGFFSIISILSLDIYLCSFISDKFVYKFVREHVFLSQQQIIWYFPLIVLSTFTMSFIVAFLRYKATGIGSNTFQNQRLSKEISQ